MSQDPRGACPPPEALDAILANPSDPRRPHVDGCALCRAVGEQLETFLEGTLPHGAQTEEAEAALAASLAAEFRAPNATAARSPAPGRPRWLRPGLAAVATLTVVGVLAVWQIDRPADPPPGPTGVLRGETPALPGTGLRLDPARIVDDGVQLSWSKLAGADRYEVIVVDADLDEVGRFDAGLQTSLDLSAEQLLALGPAVRLWRVRALAHGSEAGASSLGAWPTR